MISEGSWDTKNDVTVAENSVLCHRNKLYLKYNKNRTVILNCNIISQFDCIFDQIDNSKQPWWNLNKGIINKGQVEDSLHEGIIAQYLKSPVFLGVGQQEELNSTALLW